MERWAVFSVHGSQCYLCRTPIDLQTMEVDHIIPEHLLDDPVRLAGVLEEFGLPADFQVNSYANWMPACRSCNSSKHATVFEAALIVKVQLQRGQGKAAECQMMAERAISNAALSKAINLVARAAEASETDVRLFAPLIEALAHRMRNPKNWATFTEESEEPIVGRYMEKSMGYQRQQIQKVFTFRLTPYFAPRMIKTFQF